MIIVTGGAGFIGANFVHGWLASVDEPLINLDKLTYAGNPENLEGLPDDGRHQLIRGDIGDEKLVNGLLRQHQPRAIVNFAAESHVDRSILGPAAFIETNVVGLATLLECVRRYWDELDDADRSRFRFLQVSTDEVYGSLDPDEAPFSEITQYRPNSPYSASKAAGDHLVRAYHHTYGLPTLTTNCSNNYGPYQFPEKLIPLLIANALAGAELPIYGDGLQVRDWLYVTDHCEAVMTVLEQGAPGAVYNIGGDNEMTNLEVVHAVCDLLDARRPSSSGRTYRDQIRHVRDRPGHDRRYAIDASRIARDLGWGPKETFESGIRKTVDWYLANADWVANIRSGEYRDWVEQNYAQLGR